MIKDTYIDCNTAKVLNEKQLRKMLLNFELDVLYDNVESYRNEEMELEDQLDYIRKSIMEPVDKVHEHLCDNWWHESILNCTKLLTLTDHDVVEFDKIDTNENGTNVFMTYYYKGCMIAHFDMPLTTIAKDTIIKRIGELHLFNLQITSEEKGTLLGLCKNALSTKTDNTTDYENILKTLEEKLK